MLKLRKEVITVLKFVGKIFGKIKAQLSQKGQGMVEYALIIAFVAGIAAVALNTNLGDTITKAFTKADTSINSVGTKTEASE